MVAPLPPAEPSVTFRPGAAGSDQAAHVRLGGFDGPLGLLLSLIEARELDVLTVPLGALAEAYLDALASIEVDRMRHVSAFVAVAGQLILIKSRAMLPRPPASETVAADDTPDPEAELRARLLLYRAFRDAGSSLGALADAPVRLFRREPGAASAAAFAGARPAEGPPADPARLAEALAALVRIVPPPPPPPEVMPRTITLADRAAIIRAAIREAGVVVLQDLLRGVGDRVVAAVTFLALLELVKRREVVVEQAEPWGPIVARPRPRGEATAAGDGAEPAADEPSEWEP